MRTMANISPVTVRAREGSGGLAGANLKSFITFCFVNVVRRDFVAYFPRPRADVRQLASRVGQSAVVWGGVGREEVRWRGGARRVRPVVVKIRGSATARGQPGWFSNTQHFEPI